MVLTALASRPWPRAAPPPRADTHLNVLNNSYTVIVCVFEGLQCLEVILGGQ
jgi:hypothetical protein